VETRGGHVVYRRPNKQNSENASECSSKNDRLGYKTPKVQAKNPLVPLARASV
jgi:hypothetical protein